MKLASISLGTEAAVAVLADDGGLVDVREVDPGLPADMRALLEFGPSGSPTSAPGSAGPAANRSGFGSVPAACAPPACRVVRGLELSPAYRGGGLGNPVAATAVPSSCGEPLRSRAADHPADRLRPSRLRGRAGRRNWNTGSACARVGRL